MKHLSFMPCGIALAVLVLVGCGVNPGKNAEPVDLEGKVSIAGKDVSYGTLSLQPTTKGTMATLPISNGKVKGVVTPGKYTYYISAASTEEAFEAIPEKYRSGSMDRQIEIKTAGTVDFAFN
jgi:hypothetical protein